MNSKFWKLIGNNLDSDRLFIGLQMVLEENGYKTLEENDDWYRIAGRNITGHITKESLDANNEWQVYLDHVKCYDRPIDCFIRLPLPATAAQLSFLLKKMKWLGTQEGYLASSQLNHEQWVEDYPNPQPAHELTARVIYGCESCYYWLDNDEFSEGDCSKGLWSDIEAKHPDIPLTPVSVGFFCSEYALESRSDPEEIEDVEEPIDEPLPDIVHETFVDDQGNVDSAYYSISDAAYDSTK